MPLVEPLSSVSSLETLPISLEELSFRYAGKLLLRREIMLHEVIFQRLLSLSYFISIPSIQRKIITHECQRCGNQKRSLFAFIPCHSCKKEHLYCRKCVDMGRVMECEMLYYWSHIEPKWSQIENPCTWKGQLTADQELASNRVSSAVKNHEAELLVWAVCGAGKTEMLYPGITEALMYGKRICIATPRADVVRELLPRLKDAFSTVHIQGLYGGSRDNAGTAQVIIATTHQLIRYKAAFDVLIIDEIDAFPYHADPSLPFVTDRAKKVKNTTIYLTATPRSQQRILVETKRLPHIFVPIRFHGHPLPVPSYKMCFSLKKDLAKYAPPSSFTVWLKNRKSPKRQLLIFVPTINLAEKMKKELVDLLINQSVIITEDALSAVHAGDADREEKVEQFRKKEIFVLLTTTILERGVTFPSVDVVVLDAGHDVFDEAALVQIAGRAGRSPDDPAGEVIFFHDGKTNAMVKAVHSIVLMNKRGGFR